MVSLMFFLILFLNFSAHDVVCNFCSKAEKCKNQCIKIIKKNQLFITIIYYKLLHLLIKFAEI